MPVAEKHALVLEGGGMKAAFSNGVLQAWQEAGYYPWDAMYGTSAGGALAAWTAARQCDVVAQTWRYALDPRIINYRRWAARQGPLFDHDALIRIVYENEHPLDVDAVRRAKHPVSVTAADVHSGRCVYPDIRRGATLDWIRATGRLPMASGEPVRIGGRIYLDGGILDPIPLERAIEDGATTVTVILNNPYDGPKRDIPFLPLMVARRYPRLRDGLVRHQQIKWEAVQKVLNPLDGVDIHVVRPPRSLGITRLSRDMERIDDALALGQDVGHEELARWRV